MGEDGMSSVPFRNILIANRGLLFSWPNHRIA